MRKKLFYFFLVLTPLNGVVFLYRDSFQYTEKASYAELYGRCDEGCIDSWKGPAARYSEKELAVGRQILDTVIRKGSRTTVAKVFDIASFLYMRFHAQAGLPNQYLQSASPLQQYELLSKNRHLQLWCGNFGTMFFYFCWAANIPCRAIEIVNNGRHHIANEIYDEQAGRWLFVDVTHNLPLVKSDRGGYLNLVEFISAIDDSAKLTTGLTGDGVALNSTAKDAIQTYYSPASVIFYYHDFDKEKVYSFREKLYRYIVPDAWYVVYPPASESNALFYGKLLLLVSWSILLVILLALQVTRRHRL